MTSSKTSSRAHPEKRRTDRSPYPLQVSIKGQTIVADNWNEYGFKASSNNPDLFKFKLHQIEITIPSGEETYCFNTNIVKHWSSPQGNRAGFQFIGLPEAQTKLLRSFKTVAARTKETETFAPSTATSSVDQQKSPANNAAQEKPLVKVLGTTKPEKSLSKKGMVLSTFYGLLGLLVTWFVMSSLYSQLFRLNVETAVISRPIEKLTSPINGTITNINHPQGSTLSGGETVLSITNSNNRQTITSAEIKLDEAKLDLRAAETKLQSSRKALGVYQSLTHDQLLAAKSKLANTNATLRLAANDLRRAENLYEEQVISSMELDASRSALNKARSERSQASAELKNIEQVNQQAQSGNYFSAQRMEFDLTGLESTRDIASQRVHLAQRRLDASRNKSEYLLKAPYPAQVISLTKSVGSFAIAGEQLILLEKLESPVIDAYLTREEVAKVSKGSQANVYIPALDKSAKAEVVSIDRTAQFANEETLRFSWQNSEERTSRVTLKLVGEHSLESHEEALTGLPAHVSFSATRRP